MTQFPSLPRSGRDLSDLDALIDASIGKSDVAPMSSPLPSSSPQQERSDIERRRPARDTAAQSQVERFRISIDPAVIVATKHTALQRKVAPSEIVELALRQYLNIET